MKKPTCLATDWSKEGLGFSLMQKHCKCSGPPDPNCGVGHWKIVFAGSKTTNGAQRRYCPVEGKCLATVYGLERCRMLDNWKQFQILVFVGLKKKPFHSISI